jgi:hypothetical protein
VYRHFLERQSPCSLSSSFIRLCQLQWRLMMISWKLVIHLPEGYTGSLCEYHTVVVAM